jgi:O-antigen/teichoic acid export membrane protein
MPPCLWCWLKNCAIAAAVCASLTSSFLSGWSVVAVAAAAFGFFVASTGMGWALGRSHFSVLAVMVAGEVGIKVAAGIVFVMHGAGIFGAIGGTAIGTLAVIVFAAVIMGADRRLVRPGPHFARMLRSSAGLSGLQGLLVAAATLDVVLVEVILPPGSHVAPYQLAATLGRAPIFLAMAISMMVYPAIIGNSSHRSEDGRRVFDGLALLLPMTVLSWAVLATIPRSILLLVAPSTYDQALRFLPVTAASGLLWSVVIYLSCSLVASGRWRAALVPAFTSATLGGTAMAFGGQSFGIWGFAVIELLTALCALVGVAFVSLRLWGTEGLGKIVKCARWLLAIVPLALLHLEPAIWTGAATVIGASCVAVSFPALRFGLSRR